MSRKGDSGVKGHPIQVVARRTGLTADLLRAWEKRYEAVTPERTATGRRLYTEADIDRLLLLRRATLGGRSIGQVAHLASGELGALVAADEAAEAQAPRRLSRRSRRRSEGGGEPVRTAAGEEGARVHLAGLMAAVRRLDAEGVEMGLERAAVALSRPMLLSQVLVPMLHNVGDMWSRGEVRVAHEHIATAVTRTFIGGLRRPADVAETAPRLLSTTPAGQSHELGALLVAVAAESHGWRASYLGPNLPAEEIAAAASDLNAAVVGLSILYPADDARLPGELQQLHRLLPDDVVIAAGGPGCVGYAATLDEIGAQTLGDLDDLREFLVELRQQG